MRTLIASVLVLVMAVAMAGAVGTATSGVIGRLSLTLSTSGSITR
jgi:hypothetical protein